MMRTSFAVLAVVAGLSGCATTSTESPQGTPGATPSSTGSQSAATSGTVGTGSGTGQIGTGTGTGTRTGSQSPDLKRSVYYEFDKYDVKPEYRALIENHARWLRANPQARLTIEGNTDERGSREYNVALGQRRAESVTKMMVLLGVKPEQIEAVSFGKEKPRVTGHDESAWAENRRSDFAKR
jgi:peptidoglycan-associated lipoprotein